MRKLLIFALATLALAGAAEAAALQDAESPYPVSEVFPVEAGLNAERGFAVAVDGDWLAMGAPRDDYAPEKQNTGAVYLFQRSGKTWDQKAKLMVDVPQANAQLGFSVALRNGVLAAGAPGEGGVYIFELQANAWAQVKKLTGTSHGAGTFGRCLALDDVRLAVGAVDADGSTDGTVSIYVKGDAWKLEQTVFPKARQKGERFGSAVALAGNVLVVGAPGIADAAGAVYVLQSPVKGPVRWREKARLIPPGDPPPFEQQFGSAVATDGTRIFVGAPTADLGGVNSGALYRFERGVDGQWEGGHLLEVPGLAPGDQVGASLALSEGLLVAGAPAPPPGTGSGHIHVFRLPDASWFDLSLPNGEIRDLAGFAVAVAGEQVVVGGVLGDQGDGAAGAVWWFHCPAGNACSEEAEAVARDPLAGKRYGASVALTHDFMAVGAPESGSAYLYRRAGLGWRQEARLPSAYKADGFGSSVALEDSLLAVGAPQARSSGVSGEPVDYPDGSVDLFVHDGIRWVFETTLAPPPPELTAGHAEALGNPVAFGTSVAIAGGVVAVGAPGSGVVYLFQKVSTGWTQIRRLFIHGEDFGSAVSLRGGVLAIGAPGAAGGNGAAYVSFNENGGWTAPQLLSDPKPGRVIRAAVGRALGSAVAVGDGIIAVGAPGFIGENEPGASLFGAVFLYERNGTVLSDPIRLSALAPRRFGASIAQLGNRLVVGAPADGDTNPNTDDLDRAAVFERQSNGVWKAVADLDALQPPHGDEFGAAVALSEEFLVVTSPGPPRGDRVTVFQLQAPGGGNP